MWTNAAIASLFNLVFTNAAWANVGDASGLQPSATAGSFYISLHTADPGPTGNQTTSEAAYTSYARVAVARDGTHWTQSAEQIVNALDVTFPQATGGSETELYFGVGTASSGVGNLLRYGPLSTVFYGFTAETSGNISVPGSSFSVNDLIAFFPNSTDYALPTGITEGTIYHVISVSGDVITVSATQGGSAIVISAAGAGTCSKVTGLAVSAGVTPQITAGTLVLLER